MLYKVYHWNTGRKFALAAASYHGSKGRTLLSARASAIRRTASSAKWREVRLYQTAPISTNLILAYLGQHVLGMPRSY
jgi:acyl-CoA dehydrogenase